MHQDDDYSDDDDVDDDDRDDGVDDDDDCYEEDDADDAVRPTALTIIRQIVIRWMVRRPLDVNNFMNLDCKDVRFFWTRNMTGKKQCF